MKPALDIVIVTYNSGEVIGAALSRLGDAGNVIIVDNGSSNDIGAALEGHEVTLVQNGANYGFGTACNIGASRGVAEWILFLNPDTAVDASEIVRFVSCAARHQEAGAFNPVIADENGKVPHKSQSLICGPFSAAPAGYGDDAVPFLSGAALLVRRAVFEQVGGFDEAIFLFHEDDDLSRRILDAGFPLIRINGATFTHAGGRGSGRSHAILAKKTFWEIRAQRYVCGKWGLPFNTWRKALSAALRMARFAITGDSEQLARTRGRLAGLLSSDIAAEYWK